VNTAPLKTAPLKTAGGIGRAHGRRGFTLAEMLVVVAIILVVIGLLSVAMSSARRSARTTTCLAQLRALQVAQMAYATDHRGHFVDVGLPHGGLGFEEAAWINTLMPYYDNRLALRSPLDTSVHWPADQGGAGVPVPGTVNVFRRTSYGMNNYLSRNYSPAAALDPGAAADRMSKVPNPAATVMFLLMTPTGAFAGADHPHVEEWWIGPGVPDFPPVQAASQVFTNAAGGRAATWDSRSNWSFVDGSVATLSFQEVYETDRLNRFDPAVAGTIPSSTP